MDAYAYDQLGLTAADVADRRRGAPVTNVNPDDVRFLGDLGTLFRLLDVDLTQHSETELRRRLMEDDHASLLIWWPETAVYSVWTNPPDIVKQRVSESPD